jgi:ribosome biogenesis protein Tsr3
VLGSALTDSLTEVKTEAVAQADRVEVPATLAELSETVSQKAQDYAAAGKEHAGKLVDQVGDKLSDMDDQSLTRRDGSVTLNCSWRDKHRGRASA